MSHAVSAAKIQNNPKFHSLVRQRDGLAWSLTLIVLVIYYGFVLLIAYDPDFMTQTISADSVVPVGMPIGVGVILASIVLTGIYVYRANTTFDTLTREIIQDADK